MYRYTRRTSKERGANDTERYIKYNNKNSNIK